MSPQQLLSSLQQKPQGRKAYETHVGHTRLDGYKEAELVWKIWSREIRFRAERDIELWDTEKNKKGKAARL